jgi:hypothetical protein
MNRPTLILLACLLSCAVLRAQDAAPPPSVEDKQEAGESSAEPPARRLVKWNEYEGSLFTLRASAGAGSGCDVARRGSNPRGPSCVPMV